jgi:hypothetical protein
MTRRASIAALATAAMLAATSALAAVNGPKDEHQFGVIGHSFANGGDEERLKQSIDESSESALAFVVLTGIKAASEPCTDKVYMERRKLIANARRPMIVMPSATDWSGCKNSNGRTAAIERLNRVRELYYAEPESLGRRKIEVTRQSANAKFRSYAENMYWVDGNVLYATVNVPANNNHYLPEAGRNSEYEDRLVANRYWLNRVFALARAKKHDAVVLFSEGEIKPLVQEKGFRALLARNRRPQDGFDAPRRQVAQLARKFPGKVLLVDTAAASGSKSKPVIEWRDNVGHVSAGSRALEVHVAKNEEVVFTLKKADSEE